MTAVEWLIKKITNRQNGIFDGLPHLSLEEIYEQAKEMEKNQIIESFKEGTKMVDINDELSAGFNGVMYFYETYDKTNG